MDQEVPLYTVVRSGDGYETWDEVIGYADNEFNAQQMLQQARLLNPYQDFRIDKIKIINFLFKKP